MWIWIYFWLVGIVISFQVKEEKPPIPLDQMSKYDRKAWSEGCEYDKLDWEFHQILKWRCK